MRELVRSKIISVTGLPAQSVLGNQAPDTPLQDSFMVLRWGNVTARVGPVQRRELSVWCYDRGTDYRQNIDLHLDAVRLALAILAPAGDIHGHLQCIDWVGDGTDGYDQGYQRIYRFSNYAVVGSEEE